MEFVHKASNSSETQGGSHCDLLSGAFGSSLLEFSEALSGSEPPAAGHRRRHPGL